MDAAEAVAIGAMSVALRNTKALFDAGLIEQPEIRRIFKDIVAPFDRPELRGSEARAFLISAFSTMFPDWAGQPPSRK